MEVDPLCWLALAVSVIALLASVWSLWVTWRARKRAQEHKRE